MSGDPQAYASVWGENGTSKHLNSVPLRYHECK